MLVKTFGAAVQGINAIVVTIEVNISNGVKFFLVGLPDDAVKESHERIASALYHIRRVVADLRLIIHIITNRRTRYDLTPRYQATPINLST